MRIKVDQDLSESVAERLRAAGHDALSVRQQGMAGWKDRDLWTAVQVEKRFLVTGDKGFGDIRAHPPGTHSGILVLRPDRESLPAMLQLLEQVLASGVLETLEGAVATVNPKGLRARRRNR